MCKFSGKSFSQLSKKALLIFALSTSRSQAKTELRALSRCRIDNILPLYGISLDGPKPCLLYQYMPNGSLEDR